MGHGKRESICTKSSRVPGSLACEMQNRLAARLVPYFNVAPTHSLSPACSEGLHRGFFCRESGRVALEFAFVALAVSDFERCENAFEESVSVAEHGFFKTINFRNVNAQPDDHFVLTSLGTPAIAWILREQRAHFVNSAMPRCGSLRVCIIPIIGNVRGSRSAEIVMKSPKKKLAGKHARVRAAKSHWQLRKAGRLRILQCRRFSQFKWLIHGFSTRPGGVSELKSSPLGRSKRERVLNVGFTDWDSRDRVETNRRLFQKALGHSDSCLVTLRQVHSDVLRVIREPLPEASTGDALATRARDLLLGVQTADCIPILLVDPRHRAVAAIHAGWRGTLARIAAKTVGRMAMEFGTRPKDLLAAMGPGIGRCCYEVGPDVVKEFAAQFPDAGEWFDGPFVALASGEDPNPLPWLTMMPPGHQPAPVRCHLDLYAANSAILADAGMQRKNIFAADLCTSCRTDLLFSYRREGVTGRMMAVIGLV